MPGDPMMPRPEQVEEEFFDSLLFEAGDPPNKEMVLVPPLPLSDVVAIVTMYKYYSGKNHEDDKKNADHYADQFKKLTDGRDIEKFLAHQKRRNRELQERQ